MSSRLSPRQQKFIKDYQNLPQLAQNILKCLGINFMNLGQTKMLQTLVGAGVKDDNGKRVALKVMKESLAFLVESNFIKSGKKGSACLPEYREIANNFAIEDDSYDSFYEALLENSPTSTDWNGNPWFMDYEHAIRDWRFAIYHSKDDLSMVLGLAIMQGEFFEEYYQNHPVEIVFLNQPDDNLLCSLNPDLVGELLDSYLGLKIINLDSADQVMQIANKLCYEPPFLNSYLTDTILLYQISRGELTDARNLISKMQDSAATFSHLGWIELLEGNCEKSIQIYRAGLALIKSMGKKRKVAYDNFAGLFYAVALLQTGEESNLNEAIDYLQIIKKKKNIFSDTMCGDLHQAVVYSSSKRNQASLLDHSLDQYSFNKPGNSLAILIAFLTQCWQEKKCHKRDLELLYILSQNGLSNGYKLFAKEACGILSTSDSVAAEDRQKYEKEYKQLEKDLPIPSLFTSIKVKPKWEQALAALNSLNSNKSTVSSNVAKQERVIWQIEVHRKNYYEITPRLQKLGKNGKWSKGRALGLSTLYANPEKITCLTSQDQRVVSSLKLDSSSGYYGGGVKSYYFDDTIAFKYLVDHPHLYFGKNLEMAIELKIGSPELHVKKRKDGFMLFLKPFMDIKDSFKLVQESPTRYRYIAATEGYKTIRDIVGSNMTIPLEQKDNIVSAIGEISKLVTIQSDIGDVASEIDSIEADCKPYVQLFPSGTGVLVCIKCKPITDGGSYYSPGQGGKIVLSEIDGKQVQAKRNLPLERKNSLRVAKECETLQNYSSINNEWDIEQPEDCLELLTELQKLGDDVVVEWPKEEKFRIAGQPSSQSLSMQIKKEKDWFKATGSFAVNDDLVLDMKALLNLCLLSENRFVKLDDGSFLALSKRFKKQLDELNAYSDSHGKGVRFNPLASLAIADFTEDLEHCETDKHWQDRLKKFKDQPDAELPSTLQVTLRDYQYDGFKWLARLSNWQVGACLADDMGLGKTVQALAAILLRAPDGPTLVVAPTSVMMNWIDEAQRFAPTLNVKMFADGNRQENLDGLESFDLVICSYGLLQTESEKLAGVSWQTVVLDEAQAIKNMQTKRSKAAMKLQAEFRLITTGTPIENHLGELWNLFRFINPGLLGSHDKFRTKFATPIEKNQDKGAVDRLKKLIQPYMLRRLKRDVLQELPARTEVNIQVEMGKEEAAMYEAQRIRAVETIASAEEADEQQYFQVLAEITKLRRFCCNPQLVLPEAKLSSSKLEVFTEIVSDLIENKHKALVFSQFVGHLDLIRARLDSLGINYQYLDGSTPAKQRAARVKAFQAGDGDIFLISLKAGGSGLNLTAADYVIHMDPWWNPAVEDQASDRAHRIGQQRPVTIYRLIVKGTIEEQIVGLHKDKRDLADSLLAGSDVSGSFSASQLLALLKKE